LINVANRQNYDFYDSMMIMIKKCLNLDLQDYTNNSPLEKGAGGID
jgi:hypothetical protein